MRNSNIPIILALISFTDIKINIYEEFVKKKMKIPSSTLGSDIRVPIWAKLSRDARMENPSQNQLFPFRRPRDHQHGQPMSCTKRMKGQTHVGNVSMWTKKTSPAMTPPTGTPCGKSTPHLRIRSGRWTEIVDDPPTHDEVNGK